MESKSKFVINVVIIGKKSNSLTPPFWMTFEIFNQMPIIVWQDLGVLSNVMAHSICRKLNIEPKKCSTHIIKLDMYEVHFISELKDFLFD